MTGFLLVDKPPGPTSHDVVDAARRALRVKRIGHAGTLDPPASGLLVLGVGPAARLLRYVQDLPKTYEATGMLGVRTSTLDAAGQVLSEDEVNVERAALESALEAFRGPIMQAPPAVSAVKIDGERAYKRAARGEDVTPQPRAVTIHELELRGFESPAFRILVRCSGGTYIRSLVADVGDALGCGAHVSELRRTAIGPIEVAEAVALQGIASDAVRPVETVLRHLPRFDADEATAARARAGQRIPATCQDGATILVGPAGAVGVFEARDGVLHPMTVIGAA